MWWVGLGGGGAEGQGNIHVSIYPFIFLYPLHQPPTPPPPPSPLPIGTASAPCVPRLLSLCASAPLAFSPYRHHRKRMLSPTVGHAVEPRPRAKTFPGGKSERIRQNAEVVG
jgi:hypothetical protein